MGQLNHEPSMEDILASIKRIIAEDSEAVGAKTPRMRREALAAVPVAPEPVAQPIAEPVAAEDEAPEPVAAASVEAEGIAPEPVVAQPADAEPDESPDILELTSPMPEADAIPAPAAKAATAEVRDTATEGLLSSPAAQASRNAFAALGQMQVRVEEGAPNTLDGLVADLLKPMLREWLDHNLPPLVERLVSAEVARLSGRG